MTTDLNPYAAPKADVNAGSADLQGMYWRSGAILMARDGAVLPNRCVKCNAILDVVMKRRRFYWHHQALFLLVLLNIFVYLIVALIVRRRADVSYGLCLVHRRKRARGVAIGLSCLLFSIFLAGAAISASQPHLMLVALLGCVASIVASAVLARTLMPVRIDRAAAQLKGCGDSFLASLPS